MARQTRRVVTLGALLLASATAAYGGDDTSSEAGHAALAVDVDAEGARYMDGRVAFNFNRGWTELRVGRLTAEADESGFHATTAGLAAGYQLADAIDVSGAYVYREDSDSLEQHDFKGDITYQGAAGSIGIDLFLRSAEYETLASIERRRRDPVSIRIADSIEGRGLGLHGSVYASPRLALFVAAMVYDYDEPAELPAGLTRWERVTVSGITRDDVWLQDTVSVAATYEFAKLTLTADVTRDTTLYTDEKVLSSSLLASISLAQRWIVSPWIGYSDADQSGSTAFGGVELSVSW